jgi:hypothetical protein
MLPDYAVYLGGNGGHSVRLRVDPIRRLRNDDALSSDHVDS